MFVVGLGLFLGTHSISIVAPAWRDGVVERMGTFFWRAAYGIVALIGLAMVVRGYAELRGQTPVLYAFPRWVNGISTIIMLPVFPLVLAAYLPGSIKTASKHPMLAAIKLWAFAHLLANGALADVILFGSILAWAVADRISLKHRKDRPVSSMPAGRWNDVIVVVVGLLVYALMLNGGHQLLIGMPLV